MIEYIAFGIARADEGVSTSSEMRAMILRACASNAAFSVLELRDWSSSETGVCDVVVVDCINDQVPTRNPFGVWPRERLALVVPRDASKPPQVRALRRDFPGVMHLNQVPRDEPVSFCLYFEPWAHVRRSWTAERFLQRILFWLTETAKGTLHRPGQPVEAVYFESPIDIVLPPRWEDELTDSRNMLVVGRMQGDDKRCTFRAIVVGRAEVDSKRIADTVAVRVCVGAVVHGSVEMLPGTLGDLADRLTARGSTLLEPLCAEIAQLGAGGVVRNAGQRCLLLVSIPTRRTATDEAERVDLRGFLIPVDLVTFGVKLGVLTEFATGGKHYAATLVRGEALAASNAADWRETPVVPMTVRHSATREFSRTASAVPDEGADNRRVLAGLGALGSQLVDLWAREGWGMWTLVDPDFVQPHNVVRHLARDEHVGFEKVDVVKALIDAIRPLERKPATAFRGDVLTTLNAAFVEDLKQAVLIVDATTTLEVPRELACRDDVPRCVSVFLTPSGRASAMLFEDDSRSVRLDELEAQYYGAILAEHWGEAHLAGHQGELWVGAGCRDISAVLSNELVQLHASILARQVRLSSSSPEAKIKVWIADDTTSAVRAVEVAAQNPIRVAHDTWTVVSHAGISAKLSELRAAKLPAETGGLIVGYIDHPLKRIFIVDVLPAPSDSEGTPSGFVRGADGLLKVLEAIRDRTAGIVGYLGEWHSHPPFHTPRPSGDDVSLLAHCATVLAQDGVPALMVIVGRAGDISYSLGLQTAMSEPNA